MNSKFYTALTVILLICGACAGFIAGAFFETVHTDIYTETVTRSFNIALMVGCWIATALLCLVFGGIAKILTYLEELGAGNSVSTQTTDWECPKCHCMNKEEATECFNCHLKHNNNLQSDDKWECPKCHSLNSYNGNPECPNCHWQP